MKTNLNPVMRLFCYSMLACTSLHSNAFAAGEAAALDFSSVTWSSDVAIAQNEETHDGVDALAVGRPAHGGKVSVSAVFTGPARVSCWAKVSSEAEADFFEISVGGIALVRRSGEVGWQEYSVHVPGGAHTVDFSYRKDASNFMGADTVWLDSVTSSPAVGLTLNEGLDAASDLGPITFQAVNGSSMASAWPTAPLSMASGDVVMLTQTGTDPVFGDLVVPAPVPGMVSFLLKSFNGGSVGVTPTAPAVGLGGPCGGGWLEGGLCFSTDPW